MFKNFKNLLKINKEIILSYILFILIILFTINPTPYINATFKGFSVWATIVLPSIFCFFILSKLLLSIPSNTLIFKPMDNLFAKFYNIKNLSNYTFVMSLISGYPLGAKLICEFYNKNFITHNEAYRLISIASTSGPIFILNTIGSKIFHNYKIGIIIFVSHLLATFINGFIYRNYATKEQLINYKKNIKLGSTNKFSLNDIMLDTVISILLIGGYIALSFSIIEFIVNSKVFILLNTKMSKFISNSDVILAIIKGLIEMTNGCLALSTCHIANIYLCPILTGIITFGGFAIHLQTYMFLSKIGIKYKYFLKIKTSQTILSIIISTILSFIFL